MNEEKILALHFDDMEDDDLIELTDEQVKEIVDYRCAEQGIKLPVKVPPAPAPIKEGLEKEMIYVVRVGSTDICTLEDEDKAREITDFLKSYALITTTYEYSIGYDYTYKQALDGEPNVESKTIFKEDSVRKLQDIIAHHKKQKEAHEQAERHNNSVASSRQTCHNAVWKRIDAARDKVREAADLNTTFQEYVNITKGDKDMALTFMRKAFGDDLPANWEPPNLNE